MSKKELSNIDVTSPRRFTLAKSRIIRGKRYFQPLFAEGSLFHTPLISLRYLIYDDPAHGTKVGFIAPKKTGKAVDRNRSKRLLRESFRLQQHTLTDMIEASGLNVHFVFIARTTLSDAHAVQQQVTTLLDSLGKRMLSNSTSNQQTLG